MKVDRIEQTINIKNNNISHRIKNNYYTLTPIAEDKAILKTNPGKVINNGLNLGINVKDAEIMTNNIIKELDATLIQNNSIEYCVDVYTDFKLINNKNILKTFLKTLENHKYTSGKIDFKIEDFKWIDQSKLKGIKGYKKSRSLKLYSKYEEKNICEEGDLIRLELRFGARTITQNKIINISNADKASNELLLFLKNWKSLLPRKINKYTKITKQLIELLEKELIK